MEQVFDVRYVTDYYRNRFGKGSELAASCNKCLAGNSKSNSGILNLWHQTKTETPVTRRELYGEA